MIAARFTLIVCLLSLRALMAADSWSIALENADQVARKGTIWRAHIVGSIPTSRFDDGPYVVQVALTQSERVLAQQNISLQKLGQLVSGIKLAVALVEFHTPEEPLLVTVTVSDTNQKDIQTLQKKIFTPVGIQRSLEKQYKILSNAQKPLDPLPALWFEQAGELMLGQANLYTCEYLHTLERQINDWMSTKTISGPLRAFRDSIDNSIQPYRLHIPASQKPQVVALMLRSGDSKERKSAWSALPPAWINAANRNNVALIEVYPAGDTLWTGIAPQRTRQVLQDAVEAYPELKSIPLIVCGVGGGANGAITLAEQTPQLFAGLALYNPQLVNQKFAILAERDKWLSLRHPGMRPAHLAGMTVLVSGVLDEDAQTWHSRLSRTNTPLIETVGTPADASFWEKIAAMPLSSMPQEWVVDVPGVYGPVVVEEMNEWGIGGTLLWKSPTELQTIGIARLKITTGDKIQINGSPYKYQAQLPNKNPKKLFGLACGPAQNYTNRPFTLIIGTSESVAAAKENQTLANAFINAWINHAHGRPHTVLDTDYLSNNTAEKERGRHLILIGNTRSNLVVQELLKQSTSFPLQWDARSFLLPDGKSWLRADRHPICVTWPHPAHDGRLLIILDGSPRWLESGMPLNNVPDFAIGGIKPEDPPIMWRYFDNNWQ